MPHKGEGKSPLRFAAGVLPWLLAACMATVYLLTLNHWVAPQSLELVANVSSLSTRVELFGPVTYLVTWPFRWLPPAWIPPALNLLSVACAALSLAWLARSVALLPHDRTGDQYLRLEAGTPWLTQRSAWLPPTLAVLVCGWELTFWEHAVAATGEMLNLLLFAYLVRGLLELRADGNSARLPRLALVYGLAVANNWAMAAFAPLFLPGAAWAARAHAFRLRKLEHALERFSDARLSLFARLRHALRPLNPGLWARSLGWFLAGLSLLLLLPLLASAADNAPMDFWPALRLVLVTYKLSLLAVPKATVLLLCLGSVLPALFMTIRWGSLAGGARGADKLVAAMFHSLHAFFLMLCLWAALDLPLSPRRLGVGFACLPLYYLGALSAGYFSGYLLLVFGTPRRAAERRTRRTVRVVNLAVTATVWMVLAGVPGLMLHKNLPYRLWSRTGALGTLAAQLEACLPPPGSVVLGQSSFDLLCLQTTLIRRGQQNAYLTVDVSLLAKDPGYFDFLRERHPEFKLAPPLFHLASDLTNTPVLIAWYGALAATREVYYLQPFYGLLGESYSCQPHGLYYQLKPWAATNVLEQGQLPPDLLAQNRAFWQAFIAKPLPELVRHIPSPEQPDSASFWQAVWRMAWGEPERDPWAPVVGAFCSRALDTWGVELQRAGLLGEAGESFAAALRLRPDNAAAQINREFNRDLQAHKPAVFESAQQFEARLGKRRSWLQTLVLDGAIDEPNACYQIGPVFADSSMHRQAARQFARAQILAPGLPGVTLRLAEQLDLSLGLAQLQLGDLGAAREAYERAAQCRTNAYEAYWGLAQIASRQGDTNAIIKYVGLFRSNAPPNLLDPLNVAAPHGGR